MRDKFMTGIVAGTVIGATAGVYALYKSSPRQRRKMMRRGTKAIKNASKLMGTVSSLDMFR